MDARGPEAARPWHEKAGATFRTLVDADGILSAAWGFQAIPNAWVFDAAGVLRYEKIGGFEISRREDREALAAALKAAREEPLSHHESLAPASPAFADFGRGGALLRAGRLGEAVAAWLAAAEAAPDNLIIRKQIWQALHPEKFVPEVDYAWQREQMAREDTLGLRPANPLPEQ